MHARTGTLQVPPERIDDVVAELRDKQVPGYRDQQGYKGFSVLVDRQSGKLLGISWWESEADLKASDELGRQAREQAAATGGASSEPVREAYEVAFDETA